MFDGRNEMRSLTKDEAASWCENRGLHLNNHHPVRPAHAQQFPIPEDAGQKVALVAQHMAGYRTSLEALVWFTEWGVWPSSERAHVFERFRQSYGETRPLIEIPGFLFTRAEYEDVVSFVTLGVLFLWGVFVVTAGHVVHFSHDEFGWAATYAH